jgi:hypothetical protein
MGTFVLLQIPMVNLACIDIFGPIMARTLKSFRRSIAVT